MKNFKSRTVLASLLCAAALTLTACGENEEPADIGTNPTTTQAPAADTTTAAPETEAATEAPKTEETTTEQTSDTSTSPEETEAPETTPEETEAPETTPAETTAETTPETTPAQPWTEVPVSGILYINTDGVYSRAEAVQGSAKVTQYALNDTVNVVARTDTDYFKLDSGAFIHVSYLSENKIEITEPVTAATTVTTTTVTTTTAATTAATTTAATTTEEPAETTNSTWGQYGQRDNTQSELDFIAKTFDLLNAERAKEGLPAYQHLDVLDTISAIRAWELTIEYRSDHIRPDGSNCTSAFNQNGIIYGAWGENVAAGQATPEEVVVAWMNSPPHRAAILSDDYTHMGVGYYYAENGHLAYRHYWSLAFYRY